MPSRLTTPRRVAAAALCTALGLPFATAAGAGEPAAAQQEQAPLTWEAFGAPISNKKPMAVAKVLDEPKKYAGKTVLLEGTVGEVCQNKGCWMTMLHEGKEMRVRFKDYAFFVPKDCAGQTARIEGVFKVEKIPVDEARHYLEDAGRKEDAAKITEPVDGYTFMASGVRLQR